MIEFALGIIVGVLFMALVDDKIKIRKGKPPEKAREPTEQEVRNAERAAREYMNFMTYDGTPQDEIQ